MVSEVCKCTCVYDCRRVTSLILKRARFVSAISVLLLNSLDWTLEYSSRISFHLDWYPLLLPHSKVTLQSLPRLGVLITQPDTDGLIVSVAQKGMCFSQSEVYLLRASSPTCPERLPFDQAKHPSSALLQINVSGALSKPDRLLYRCVILSVCLSSAVVCLLAWGNLSHKWMQMQALLPGEDAGDPADKKHLKDRDWYDVSRMQLLYLFILVTLTCPDLFFDLVQRPRCCFGGLALNTTGSLSYGSKSL